jgi:hypothetical protein
VCMSYAHRLLDSLGMGVLKRGLNQRGSPRDAYEMCDGCRRHAGAEAYHTYTGQLREAH